MIKFIKILLIALFISHLDAQIKSYDDYKVYSVTPKTTDEENYLKSLENIIDELDFWDNIHRESFQSIRIMIPPASQNYFEELLKIKNINFKIIIENVEEKVEHERSVNNMIRARTSGRATRDFNHFWLYTEIEEYLHEIAANYSDIVELKSIGQTYDGRDILALHLSKTGKVTGDRPIILVDATTHAREWIGTMAALDVIHELVEHHDEYYEILDEIDWIIIPVFNVDGYIHCHAVDRFWRKTRSENEGTLCRGVDPNRNFDYKWETVGGGALNPCSLTFRGFAPNTEVEVQVLSEFMKKFYPSTKIYLSFHSHGQYILYPFTYDYVEVENRDDHYELGNYARTAIYAVNQTLYAVGKASSTLYTASGVAHDYSAAVAGIEMSFTIELPGGGNEGFDIEPHRIGGVLKETFPAVIEFGRYATRKWGGAKKN